MQENTLAMNNFIPTLLKRVPELESIFAEHLKDNGEVLPHVLLGQITRNLMNLTTTRK